MEFAPIGISNTSGMRAITSAGQYLNVGGGQGDQMRIYNFGPNKVCILDGDGTQTAAMPTDSATANGKGSVIAAGATEIFSMKAGWTNIHAICAATETATIFAGRGNGN